MANYIAQEILSEAYTHFEIDEFPSDQALNKVKADLIGFFEERAKFLFGDAVTVTVEFEEGSLKTRLKVLGASAIIATNLVADYGSVREGIDRISRDATMLAQSGILEIAFRSKTAFCDQVTVERRKGVYGRASDLMSQLDAIREVLNNPSIPDKKDALNDFNRRVNDLIVWDQRVDTLFAKLENNETKGCIASGLLEELARLPDEAIWLKELQGGSFRAKAIKSDVALYTSLQGAAGAMKAIITIAKNKMVDRVKQVEPKNA
jgi:hypothetical protein